MLIDSLIPEAFKKDIDRLYKARVLLGITSIYFIIIALIEFWLLLFTNTSLTGKLFGMAICMGMQSGYLASALLLRYKSRYNLAANIATGLTVLGIVCAIAISGGPIVAPSVSMNILPIIMSFILLGKRGGLIWTQIILTIHMIFMVALTYKFPFWQLLKPETLPIQHLAHWIITYSAMFSLLFVYDNLNSRLKEERDSERRKFEHLASHDPLTNLANRLQFDINLNKALSRSKRNAKKCCLLILDLDGFKPINDELGHDAGDLVLQEISKRLLSSVRDSDTVARLGGDEFGIILEDIDDEEKIIPLIEKIQKVIGRPVKQVKLRPRVTASIGIAVYPVHTDNKEELIKCADIAMYKAKQLKNQWALFSTDLLKVQS